MPVTRSPSRPVSGSPAYSPDDLPVYRGGGVVCSIALTGGLAATLGGLPMAISGQTLSYTNAGSGVYAASQPVGLAYPIDWAGERLIELRRISASGADASFNVAIIDPDGFTNLRQLLWNGTLWETSGLGDVAGLPTDVMAIGLRGDGVVTVYKNGVAAATGTAAFDPNTATIIVASFVQDQDGRSASWEIVTNAADFTQTYPAGTRDWCDNLIS